MDYNLQNKEYIPGKINRIMKAGLRYQYQQPNYEKEVIGFDGATHWVSLRFEIGTTF